MSDETTTIYLDGCNVAHIATKVYPDEKEMDTACGRRVDYRRLALPGDEHPKCIDCFKEKK